MEEFLAKVTQHAMNYAIRFVSQHKILKIQP